MIKVTVEVLPAGHAEYRRTVGLMHIANISNLARRSDYKVDIMEGDNPSSPELARSPARFMCAITTATKASGV